MGKKILMLVGEFSEEYEIFVFEQCILRLPENPRAPLPNGPIWILLAR
jgi:hypothetical protein